MTREEVLQKLKTEFNENINSHVFLVETDNIEKSLEDIKKIIIEKIAKNDPITAKQIEEENYLELIIVRPETTEIKKESILELQTRLKTAPILNDYIFYIITPAEAMNEIAANKLLKTIEEPNPNMVGFLITTNADLLLPTIKSRCETVTLMYNDQKQGEIDPELLKIAEKLIKAIETKDHISYFQAKSDKELNKDTYKIVENLIKDYYNTACNVMANPNLSKNTLEMIQKSNTYAKLIKKSKYLNKTLNKLSKNMNGDLLLEKIFIEIKGM